MDFKYGIPFGGEIGNMLESFFHPEKGYEEAEREFRKAWEQSRATQQPFINQGQSMFPGLQGAYGALLDPEGLLNKWMSGYQTSPYAKQSIANATQSGLDAASQQGLLGSSAATQNIQNSANYLMNKDRQAYLDDLMKKYMEGVGLGKDIYGIGANMAGELGRQGMEFGRDIGGAKQWEFNAPGNLLGRLINMGANIYTGGKTGLFQGNMGNNMGTSIAA